MGFLINDIGLQQHIRWEFDLFAGIFYLHQNGTESPLFNVILMVLSTPSNIPPSEGNTHPLLEIRC